MEPFTAGCTLNHNPISMPLAFFIINDTRLYFFVPLRAFQFFPHSRFTFHIGLRQGQHHESFSYSGLRPHFLHIFAIILLCCPSIYNHRFQGRAFEEEASPHDFVGLTVKKRAVAPTPPHLLGCEINVSYVCTGRQFQQLL